MAGMTKILWMRGRRGEMKEMRQGRGSPCLVHPVRRWYRGLGCIPWVVCRWMFERERQGQERRQV